MLLYYLVGPLDRVQLVPRAVTERREGDRNFWVRLSRAIMRRPVLFAAGTTALLLVLAAPVTALDVGPGSNKGIPQNLAAVRGLDVIGDAVGDGALAPTELVVDTGREGGAADAAVRAAFGTPRGRARAGSRGRGGSTSGAAGRFVDPSRRYVRLIVTGQSEYGSPAALHFVDRLRDGSSRPPAFPAASTPTPAAGRPGARTSWT